MSLADCHRLSLVKSDNELSEKMVERMGGFRALKLKALEYCGMTESDVDAGYFETTGFTARMMLGILEYLYDGGEVFAGQLELMKTAQEGEYLRSGSCGLEIAQKYGAQVYNGLMNYCAAGIVYADEPFLVVVYTRGVGGPGELMGELCDLLAEFCTDPEPCGQLPEFCAAAEPHTEKREPRFDPEPLLRTLERLNMATGQHFVVPVITSSTP